MEKIKCATCASNKTTLRCGLCEEAACKTCAHLFDEDAFSFLPKVPDELAKGIYCHSCYVSQIEPHVEAYEKTMAAARKIDIYTIDQGKETRLIPRVKDIKYVIDNCADEKEMILRFAFFAVLDGYTTLVDVDILSEKVRDGTFQTTRYFGSAVPANAKPEHIVKDKSLRHNPN